MHLIQVAIVARPAVTVLHRVEYLDLEQQMSNEKKDPPPPSTRPADLHPTSEQFWKARGYPTRPPDWETRDPSLPPPAKGGK